jgi:hypothetical protein
MDDDPQPYIDRWPVFGDEQLSKVMAPFDVAAARLKLARSFKASARSQPRRRSPGVVETKVTQVVVISPRIPAALVCARDRERALDADAAAGMD